MSKYGRMLPALALGAVLTLAFGSEVRAQTATDLDCRNCVKSKQIKNGKVKGKDLKDGAVDSSKIEDGSVSGADIADGAISMSKLGSDLTLLGLSGIASMPPAAFVPMHSDPDYTALGFGPVIRNQNLDDGFFCVHAAVPLPDGAVVNRMEAIVSDASDTEDLTISLQSWDADLNNPNSVVEMATVSSSGNAVIFETVSTATITDPVVDLAVRFYYLISCPPVSTAFFGVRVYY